MHSSPFAQPHRLNNPQYTGIDAFNKNVITKVITDLKNEHALNGGISTGMQNYGGLGGLASFGGINDEANNGNGLGGLNFVEDE
jgi:hypothetical protein